MANFNNRIQSDINLLVSSIDVFELLYPQGYQHYLQHADRTMYGLSCSILEGNGFSLDKPITCGDEMTLFNLMLSLEINVISQPTNYSKLKQGYLTKVWRVYDANRSESHIYNKVLYKTHKYKFYFCNKYF